MQQVRGEGVREEREGKEEGEGGRRWMGKGGRCYGDDKAKLTAISTACKDGVVKVEWKCRR